MYQFPMLEVEKKIAKSELKTKVKERFGVELTKKVFAEKHILSHQHIEAVFWRVGGEITLVPNVKVDLTTIHDYPLPRLIDRFIERSEEHTSELQSRPHLVCRLLLEKKKKKIK